MHSKKQGFTLIELMVVIAIISLLSSIVMVASRAATSKGRDAARRENLSAVKLALELRFNEVNGYPVYDNAVGIAWNNAAVVTPPVPPPLTDYIANGIPGDPLDVAYIPLYRSNANGSVYSIRMYYENLAGNYCKTGGSGVDPTWFSGAPFCEQ
jgi:prepilin-type N-terminal cleavage/methylation domain-containing protein